MRSSRFIISAALFVSIASPAVAAASTIPVAFGGTVLSVLPCLTAPGFFAVNLLEPLSIPPVNTYILSLASPFLSHVPPHPGQHIIGRTTGFYSCIIDINPKHYIVWVDPLSVFYGSSI